MLLAAALLAALAAIAVAVAAMRQSARSREELEAARSRLARIDAELPRIEQHGTISATALRRDVRVSFEVSAAREDRAVIVQLLIDFRDVSGAEEAIYWRWMHLSKIFTSPNRLRKVLTKISFLKFLISQMRYFMSRNKKNLLIPKKRGPIICAILEKSESK
jgi:hypothetical protein